MFRCTGFISGFRWYIQYFQLYFRYSLFIVRKCVCRALHTLFRVLGILWVVGERRKASVHRSCAFVTNEFSAHKLTHSPTNIWTSQTCCSSAGCTYSCRSVLYVHQYVLHIMQQFWSKELDNEVHPTRITHPAQYVMYWVRTVHDVDVMTLERLKCVLGIVVHSYFYNRSKFDNATNENAIIGELKSEWCGMNGNIWIDWTRNRRVPHAVHVHALECCRISRLAGLTSSPVRQRNTIALSLLAGSFRWLHTYYIYMTWILQKLCGWVVRCTRAQLFTPDNTGKLWDTFTRAYSVTHIIQSTKSEADICWSGWADNVYSWQPGFVWRPGGLFHWKRLPISTPQKKRSLTIGITSDCACAFGLGTMIDVRRASGPGGDDESFARNARHRESCPLGI